MSDSPAALAPHETPKVHTERGLLAVGQTTGSNFAVYDVSCRLSPPGSEVQHQPAWQHGHQGNFAPDGKTYYLGQSFFGIGASCTSWTSPIRPIRWSSLAGNTWAMAGPTKYFSMRTARGCTRGKPACLVAIPALGPDGLVIEDVSDYQFRRPNPQIRIISTLFWDDQGTAEPMYPFSSKGRQYVVSGDESGGNIGVGGAPAACARGASPHGYPNIIDVTDERNPKIVAKLRLQVSDPANCLLILNDPAEVGGSIPGYNEERCVTDRPNNPTMLACAFQMAGLRVFDIRDLSNPKEIAYWKPGAVGTQFLPGSLLWNATANRTMDRVAGYPRFFIRKPGHGKAKDNGNGAGQGMATGRS